MHISCYGGFEGVVSKCLATLVIEVVGICVLVGNGFNGSYLDCMQLPRPNMKAQTLFFYVLFCVCFEV